jgi:Tol biopolymer transport system component
MDRGSSEDGASSRLTSLRLALAAIPLSLLMAACGGTSARHALVYEKPVTSLPSWGWIWRAAPDGSHPQRLVRGYEPSVSPDGRWIVYLHKGEQQIGQTTKSRQSLWLISSGGGKPRQLGRASEWIEVLQWSPDSKRFLVLSAPGLEVVDRASGAIRLLSVTTRRIGIGTASFSPDGRAVAYDRFAAGGSDIYVISSGGGRAQRLTADHTSSAPLWGPSAIAYFRGRGNTRGDVWLMADDGSQKRPLTRTGAAIYPAAWSQDGRHLLAAYPATHNGRLWAVELASGRARPLTPWIGDLVPQGLSADGRTVYAAIGCGGTISPFGLLETIPFAGGAAKVIVRGPCRGSWSN